MDREKLQRRRSGARVRDPIRLGASYEYVPEERIIDASAKIELITVFAFYILNEVIIIIRKSWNYKKEDASRTGRS